ncbi:poly(R)-hydroxyalkanoic acid synthase subunit PhaE [Halomarina ordinaria]|uniref:Poly(3-hydroxyalkanoate) polymerase subunit PhaE n=1 Tax=Halomarina ordinaria TaxID=3033939 RepID=A0ABD5UCK1_9EURY|nr:poly(R)-hydroxyalkanoic acid synthase subunit PhaE [Halomarina sp. PSRA2]
MSDTDPQEMQERWTRMVEQMNDAMARSVEQNLEAQATFMETWADAIDGSMPDEDTMAESFESYGRAYEVWMDAAETMYERVGDAAGGEDVSFTEFRDIWLRSANEAFKEVMGTTAFAAAQGNVVEAMMELQQETEDVSQETLTRMGLPTRGDMDEVGERLVELERRQQRVEDKLDQVLDHLEE